MARLRKKINTKDASRSRVSSTHNHTGFVIALLVATVLLFTACVMAYLSWYNDVEMASVNDSIVAHNWQLLDENQELVDKINQTKPQLFYYTVNEGNSFAIHSVDDKGVHSVVYKPTDTVAISVYAQPRPVVNGNIFIHAPGAGDDNTLRLRVLNLALGVLSDAKFSSEFPAVGATKLSPDEKNVATVYDNPDAGHNSLELKVWNLETGTSTTLTTLIGDERFAGSYDGLGGAYGQVLDWTSLSCVRALIYQKFDDVYNDFKEYRTFCL